MSDLLVLLLISFVLATLFLLAKAYRDHQRLVEQRRLIVEQSRIIAEQRQRMAEQDTHLRVLDRATALAAGDFERIEEFLEPLAALINEDLHYDQFGIGMVNDQGQTVYLAGYGVPDEWKGRYAQAPGEGVVGWVTEHGEPLLVPDVQHDPRYVQIRNTTRSELCVPLCVQGQVLGVVNVESDHVGTFTERDLNVLRTLTNTVAATLKRLMEREAAARKLQTLTKRESEVLCLLDKGLGNQLIARDLKIAVHTVETHLKHIYAKLGVTSRAEAIVWSLEQGLFESNAG